MQLHFAPLAAWTVSCLACAFSATAADDFAPLDAAILDEAACRQWVAGEESPVSFRGDPVKEKPVVVWTRQSWPFIFGVRYGTGRDTGRRHMRIGFTREIDVGGVLASGGGVLSVLKPGAAYPGDLDDDSQWITAEHLGCGGVSSSAIKEGQVGLWVLPEGTRTRAVRFSHVPAAGDGELSMGVGGIWILPRRFGNVAPQALVQTRARDDASARLVDGANRQGNTWENDGRGPTAVSPENPEEILLVWPKPMTLGGLCLVGTGFGACEAEAFVAGDDMDVHDAAASSWKLVAKADDLKTWYPLPLGPNWLPFAEPIATRAIRVRITAPAKADHPHLADKVKDGRRVWLGELLALAPLAAENLTSLVVPKATAEPPPIPVRFTLPEAGVVTLVIDDMDGKRVRNLVSETPFPAGENIAWWDGSDDLLRDPDAAHHGLYHIPTRPVAPGTYVVRGLWRKPLELRYEFSIYNAGKPAWSTADNTGGWLTTHTPPTSLAFVPGVRTTDGQPLVFIGCFVAEGGHGLQWLHEDGTKVGGQLWAGGTWTGGPTLAVDSGANAVADHLCYVGSIWEGELRLTAKTRALGDHPVFKLKLGDDPRPKNRKPTDPRPETIEGFEGGDRLFVLSGLAARDGVLVCSMLRQNELVFVDSRTGEITGRRAVQSPRGATFDDLGRLHVLSGTKLVRFDSLVDGGQALVIASDLEDPRHVARDSAGRWLVSDRGTSHQVKVFDGDGRLLSRIGKAGAPATGSYDPLHMNNPNGLAVDSQGRVWVAENDNFPRRVSVWSADGKIVRAFYGPSEYGGGGVLDPQEPKRFFYKGMEFALDWQAGTDRLVRVFARPDPLLSAHYGHFSPDTPLYPRSAGGRRYFTSCFTHNPTSGDGIAFIWLDGDPEARLVAAAGDAHEWHLIRGEAFRHRWPEGTKPDLERPAPEHRAVFVWSDASADGRPQPDEITIERGSATGITVTRELGFLVNRLGADTALIRPESIDARGTPRYELHPERLGPAGGRSPSSGGNQALVAGDWLISTNAPEPFSPYGLGGSFQGQPRWAYPSPWPGLHASHEAAVPDRPGMVVGHTRLLGDTITGKAGAMFCVNGNMGDMYLFTVDGLFVATLFHDIRLRPNWASAVAERNMDVTNLSLHDENFWPSITQVADGRVFLVDGGRTSLVRVDGLDSLVRLPEQTIKVTPADLDTARDWIARAEAARQKSLGTGRLTVARRADPPTVDGSLEDWPGSTDWAVIDRRGTKANFNSKSIPYETTAAVCVAGDRLYAAWRTSEKNLLANSGETPEALFKTGGCLDLMLETDTDQRLLVTLVKGQPRAVLYRSQVPGTKEPVKFSSPWRSIEIDSVEDVSSQVAFAADKEGRFEIGVPLALLHWDVQSQPSVRADIGVLRGSGGQTTQRVYWSNKATGITADVPSEAELTPKLWGTWRVE